MNQRTAAEWARILGAMGVKPSVFGKWAQVFANTIKPGTFSSGDEDLKAFLPQIIHESQGMTKLVESLNYSAKRLMAVWPSRFPTVASTAYYAGDPEALANYVYGGRLGNKEPGDGWKYRGRSFIMTTGFDNYARVGDLIGQDLTIMPELLEQPHFALEAAIAWWEDKIPDSMLGDPEKVTRRVNGGLIGLADREELSYLAQGALA